MARKFLVACAAMVIALTLRIDRRAAVPPFDDLYHLKRIRYSAAHFPHVLALDPDRGLNGAWCPWPPLYDLACSAASMGGDVDARVRWMPPILFSLLAAVVAWINPIAGFGMALSPYLIGISRTAHIDHHWVEPALLLLIVYATAARRPLLLGVALTAAMFVQTAFLIAAALAFVVCFARKWGAVAFVIPAAAMVVYRLAQPDGYPENAWFLGWPHAACFAAAAVALWRPPWTLPFGAIVVAPYARVLANGFSFLDKDAWLRTIIEFQPMFHDGSRVGTDIANLTGGAILIFIVARRHRTLAIFGIAYLLLALSSRRFLVPAIPLLVFAGGVAVVEAKSRWAAVMAALMTLAPPVAYDVWAAMHPEPADAAVVEVAKAILPLPPGRVLAPWWMGHAIDVIGGHAVVIDNFGSMPDAALFARANAALADGDVAWCRAHGIRYIVRRGRVAAVP